ncbi:hypothetical protein ABEB36_005503 [Hypothenemus hampei]|uniref:Uncharacterized protein n=1 Tax=Hypothenemus hampei TaxID=57062 RepID=A0ABD1EYF0_HYPHA
MLCQKFSFLFLTVLLSLFVCEIQCKRKLLRKRRYVSFPEGAAFSAVVCMTSQTGLTDGANIFSEGVNWGLVYDLPNDTRPLFDYHKAVEKRRNRRDLYGKIESVLTSMGYNGRSCILRSLCEASGYFKMREDSLIHHILGLIFRFPREPILSHEPDDHKIYHWATSIGSENSKAGNDEENTQKCSNIFLCPFSLLDMALGLYSPTGPNW